MVGEDQARHGLYKSAVLLVSLGSELAAQVLSQMDDRHVERLIGEMIRLRHVDAVERDRVVEEFTSRLEGEAGGPDPRDEGRGMRDERRSRLSSSLIPHPSSLRISGEAGARSAGPVPGPEESEPLSLAGVLETTSPESLAALVADEHPLLIALLIGQLSVDQAAAMLAALPAPAQGPVAARLAEIEAPAPIALDHLERYLSDKLRGSQDVKPEASDTAPRRVADILTRKRVPGTRRSVENLVLGSLEQQSPPLAQKVNQVRFTFEILLELEGRTLQRVLRDVESDTLQTAMKGLDEVQQQVIYSNMSERAAARLREDLEISGPTQLREVEAAHQKMLGIARSLQESGEIQLRIGTPEEQEHSVV